MQFKSLISKISVCMRNEVLGKLGHLFCLRLFIHFTCIITIWLEKRYRLSNQDFFTFFIFFCISYNFLNLDIFLRFSITFSFQLNLVRFSNHFACFTMLAQSTSHGHDMPSPIIILCTRCLLFASNRKCLIHLCFIQYLTLSVFQSRSD